jgi:hypothetical protein
MKRKEGKKITMVVIAAVIISSMMTIFMPLAAASVASFTITPDTGTTSEYNWVYLANNNYTSGIWCSGSYYWR